MLIYESNREATEIAGLWIRSISPYIWSVLTPSVSSGILQDWTNPSYPIDDSDAIVTKEAY